MEYLDFISSSLACASCHHKRRGSFREKPVFCRPIYHRNQGSWGFSLVSPPCLEHAVLKNLFPSLPWAGPGKPLERAEASFSVKMVAVKIVLGENRQWVHFKSPTTSTPSTIHSPFTLLVVLECFSSEGGYLLGSSPGVSVCLRVKEREVKLRKAFIYRYLKAAGPWNSGMYYDVPLEKQKQHPLQPDPAIFIT